MAFIHCSWLTKLLFLLLLMSQSPHAVDTRPARGSPTSDLIAGNEFLKLFMERDELQRDLYSAENEGHAEGIKARSSSFPNINIGHGDRSNDADESKKTVMKIRNSARSLDYKALSGGSNHENNEEDDDDNDEAGKQVVKLVTSGSKIVFFEEYEDVDDAVVDAQARDIDLKREKVKKINHLKANDENRFYQESKSALSDEFKVVAVSVSSSSKRGSPVIGNRPTNETPAKPVSKFSIKTSFPAEHEHESRYMNSGVGDGATTSARPVFNIHTTTKKPYTTTATTTPTTAPSRSPTTKAAKLTTNFSPLPATNDIDDFINRSHKSEFSIEEAEPLTMPQKLNKMRRAHARLTDSANDSENSASSNIQNILASPALMSSASMRSTSIVMPTSSNQPNSTQYQATNRQARINQSPSAAYDMAVAGIADSKVDTSADTQVDLVEDKLLPFQSVIYHDHGQEGRGPQSRSISYSSISQNVEDLQAWQQAGILAEAQRNVSESLKPSAKSSNKQLPPPHESESSKFYSVPAKMYSIPSKFYSEPAKVYSQPAKVYGQQEKFYSEPAKIYGQPSKFYSEPAKVYSQPSKVYGEPAKTYWPQTPVATTTTTTTSSTTTTMTPASQTLITTFAPFAASASNLTARRPPAIVSRITFGETVSSSPPAASLPADVGIAKSTVNVLQQHTYHQQHTHQSQNQYQQHHQQQHQYQHNNNRQNNQNTQSRRVLFNLDKLPYDLLNAPEQPLLEADSSRSQLNPCAESAAVMPNAKHHQQQQQHLRQHSSFSDQHSNQNSKGLPNRELVKCVSKFSVAHHQTAELATRRPQQSAPSTQNQQHQSHQQHHYTTERSQIDELYQPTPEQNYEIEESVSVMTNGRAHGVQGNPQIALMTITSTTATPPSSKVPTTRQRFRPTVGANLRFFGHAKSGNEAQSKSNKSRYHNNNNNNEYNDGDEDNDNNDEDNIDDINNGDGGNTDVGNGGGDDDDDSKVAYVVEGRNYRKYRVEEKTDDGFIVGEFGVVDHNDGNLRGVRYTADSNINPSLISKALVAFLKLK